ncbi:hypothetical protein GF322_02870 [Candidatus Dependentiae bacterium]|nr:hypothetical protein [Candidatus Dependentiae bacterium]
MKKFFFVLFHLFIIFYCNAKNEPNKLKIVIFTSKGGNGHMSACSVLKECLPNCEIKLINPIYDFFHNIFDGEKWYSNLVKYNYINLTNFIVRHPGKAFFKLRYKTFEKRFERFLAQEKPDLLISVIPFLNYPSYIAAKKCNIPFMIITLDADLTNWLINMEKCKDHDFTITVQTKTPLIKKQLLYKKIPMKCVHEVGPPLRKDFFTYKNPSLIKKEWDIPENKDIIMLIRGGTGSKKLFDYARTIIKTNNNLHLLVCVGKNHKLAQKLNRLKKNNVTLSVIQFTNKIADLMSISDLLITQPSPNVCNEALYFKLPILIDMTSTCLFWERATVDWIKIYGNGQIFKHMKQINQFIPELIKKKKSFQIQKTPHCFNNEIKNIIKKQLELAQKK